MPMRDIPINAQSDERNRRNDVTMLTYVKILCCNKIKNIRNSSVKYKIVMVGV